MNDSKTLRDCLGRFATGVTVVTCRNAAGAPCGITANSFSSVSLEPPRILWNIAKVSQSLDAYLAASHFAVNVLAEDQRPLAEHFAQSLHDSYANTPFALSEHGAPMLEGCLAWLECRTERIHDCGDHYIIIGDVLDFRRGSGRPLLFFGGAYRGLDDPS